MLLYFLKTDSFRTHVTLLVSAEVGPELAVFLEDISKYNEKKKTHDHFFGFIFLILLVCQKSVSLGISFGVCVSPYNYLSVSRLIHVSCGLNLFIAAPENI